MRKILGFVVGSLSIVFLVFAYFNLASAGNDEKIKDDGKGKTSSSRKNDPCNDFVSKASKLKNPDYRGGKVLECTVMKKFTPENESDCTRAKMKTRAEEYCEKKVESSDYEVKDFDVFMEEKSGKCVIECDIRKKTGGTPTATPVATAVPATSSPTASPVVNPVVEIGRAHV